MNNDENPSTHGGIQDLGRERGARIFSSIPIPPPFPSSNGADFGGPPPSSF